MALFSIPTKYKSGEQACAFIKKQVEDISLKVTVVKRITSVKISVDDGQIYHSNVREKEELPVVIDIGEKETVYESRSQQGDNSDNPESGFITHSTKFDMNKSLAKIIHLTNEVGIQFSSHVLSNQTSSMIEKSLGSVNEAGTLIVSADIVPSTDLLPNKGRNVPKSNILSLHGKAVEANKVNAYGRSSDFDVLQSKLRIEKSPVHVFGNNEKTIPDDGAHTLPTQNDLNQQSCPLESLQSLEIPDSQRLEPVRNGTPMFDETSESPESLDLPEIESDVEVDIDVEDLDDEPTDSRSTPIKTERDSIESVNHVQRASATRKIRGPECTDCYTRFPLKKLYHKHKEEGTAFLCDLCGEKLNSQCWLKQHCHDHYKHEGKTFTCLICENHFPSKIRFLKHACHGKTVSCKACYESFTSPSHLDNHMEAIHGAHRCEVCHKVFSSEESLKRHRASCLKPPQAVKLEGGGFKCLVCAGVFLTISLYVKHTTVGNVEECSNKCDSCGKLCSSPCALNLHSYIHDRTTNRKHVCTVCKEEFKSRHMYLAHRQKYCGKASLCRTSSKVDTSENKYQNSKKHASQKPFRCDSCGLQFHSKYWLKKHLLLKGCKLTMKKHRPCGFKYGRLPVKKGKQLKHKVYKTFTCETCGKLCSTQGMLLNHSRTHEEETPDGKYHCTTCDRTYNRRTSYLKHKKKVHCDDTNFVKCPSCNKVFANEKSLRKHSLSTCSKQTKTTNMNQNLEPYYCATCDKVYTTKTSIFRHKVSKECLRFTCTICRKRCSTEKILSDHILTHQEQTEDGKYHCAVCDKNYCRRTSYLKHKRIARCDPASFSKCSSCSNIFANKKALDLHKKIAHKEGDSYYCEICQRNFTSRKAFSRHKAMDKCSEPKLPKPTEYIKKSAQCDTCGKIFCSQSSLMRHMRRHTGDKPHVCPHCGKKFADRFILKNHVHNVHVGTRSFLCQVCGKSYKTMTHLDRHTQSHTEKNLHCTFCTRKYKYAKTLQEHQSKVHASLLANIDLHQLGLVE